MKIIEKKIDLEKNITDNCMKAISLVSKNACVFDIETTGFSANIASLYLIGACYFDKKSNNLILKQWFANDYDSEKEILDSFRLFLKDFDSIIHFYGDNFDIPFLNKKYKDHGLPSPFSKLDSIDLLKKIRRKKNWFKVPNNKLVTMEKFIGYIRNDQSNGGECIELYNQYMQKKILKKDNWQELEEIILLHNNDDLIGTFLACQYIFYSDYLANKPSYSIKNINKKTFLEISDTIDGFFPKNFEVENNDIIISFEDNSIFFYIPISQGEYKHFYTDYKNYIYLPEEDTAIHKDIGIYVDAKFREKAKAKNCYTKINSTFLPLPFNLKGQEKWNSFDLFFKEYKDKKAFIQLNLDNPNMNSFLSDENLFEIVNCYYK